MSLVPPEGYPAESKEFDKSYALMLNALQSALAAGDQDKLGDAVDAMSSLTELAVPLMQKPLPGGVGNYGPDFRLVI